MSIPAALPLRIPCNFVFFLGLFAVRFGSVEAPLRGTFLPIIALDDQLKCFLVRFDVFADNVSFLETFWGFVLEDVLLFIQAGFMRLGFVRLARGVFVISSPLSSIYLLLQTCHAAHSTNGKKKM